MVSGSPSTAAKPADTAPEALHKRALCRGKPEPWEEGCENEGVTVVEYYAAVKRAQGSQLVPAATWKTAQDVSDGEPSCGQSRTAAPYNVHMKTPWAHGVGSSACEGRGGSSACLSNVPPVERRRPTVGRSRGCTGAGAAQGGASFTCRAYSSKEKYFHF